MLDQGLSDARKHLFNRFASSLTAQHRLCRPNLAGTGGRIDQNRLVAQARQRPLQRLGHRRVGGLHCLRRIDAPGGSAPPHPFHLSLGCTGATAGDDQCRAAHSGQGRSPPRRRLRACRRCRDQGRSGDQTRNRCRDRSRDRQSRQLSRGAQLGRQSDRHARACDHQRRGATAQAQRQQICIRNRIGNHQADALRVQAGEFLRHRLCPAGDHGPRQQRDRSPRLRLQHAHQIGIGHGRQRMLAHPRIRQERVTDKQMAAIDGSGIGGKRGTDQGELGP